MKIACPSCQAQFEVAPEHAGKVAPCPQCGKSMQIPVPTAQVIGDPAAPADPAAEKKAYRRLIAQIAHGVALGIIEYSAILLAISLIGLLIFAAIAGVHAKSVNSDIDRAIERAGQRAR